MKNKVCEFVKEHIELIKLLNSSKEKKFIKEADKQTKEVLKYLKNL